MLCHELRNHFRLQGLRDVIAPFGYDELRGTALLITLSETAEQADERGQVDLRGDVLPVGRVDVVCIEVRSVPRVLGDVRNGWPSPLCRMDLLDAIGEPSESDRVLPYRGGGGRRSSRREEEEGAGAGGKGATRMDPDRLQLTEPHVPRSSESTMEQNPKPPGHPPLLALRWASLAWPVAGERTDYPDLRCSHESDTNGACS